MDNLTSDIVEQLVSKLDNKLRVIQASQLTNGEQTIRVCGDTKWLVLYKQFTDGTLVSNINGNILNVTPPSLIQVGDILEIPIPLFFHGTPYNTVQEWHDFSTFERGKLPFIWLVTPTNDNNQDFRSAIKRIASCQIFFVHWSNWVELNQNRVNDAIRPLMALKNEFIKACNRSPQIIDKLDGHQTKEYPKFGKESSKGVEEVIYNSTLAAVRIELDLRIKDFEICKC